MDTMQQRQIDLTKIGMCEKGCNYPGIYYCQKECTPGVTYYCQDCLETSDHDHRTIARDRECSKLYQAYSLVFNEVEKLHEEVVESYSPFQDIINWAQEMKEKLGLQNENDKESKDLTQDY